MPTITISDETYRRLSARAAARGVTLEEAMVEEPESDSRFPKITPEESSRRLQVLVILYRMAEEHSRTLPAGHTLDIDRDSFYRDDQ